MSAPTTPMEDGGALPTTTEVATFLAAVDSGSSRASVTSVAETANERPVWRVELGHPTPHDTPKKPLYVIATQHGNERSSTESALRFLRDLAYTEDADWTDYLTDHTVVVSPLANPDGYASNIRGTGVVDDMNREWVRLAGNEIKSLQRTVRDYQPEIVLDCHEFGGADLDEMYYRGSDNPTTDSRLNDYVLGWINGPIAAANTAAGYDTFLYPVGAATEFEQTAKNAGALRHAITMLIECPWFSFDLSMRVEGTLLTLETIAGLHRDNAAEITALHEAVVSTAISNGSNQAALPVRGAGTIDPGPAGYLLTEAQESAMELHVDVFDIEVLRTVDGDAYVPMGQRAYPVLPYLLDDVADQNIVSATRLSEVPELASVRANFAIRGGVAVPGQVGVIRDGQFVPA